MSSCGVGTACRVLRLTEVGEDDRLGPHERGSHAANAHAAAELQYALASNSVAVQRQPDGEASAGIPQRVPEPAAAKCRLPHLCVRACRARETERAVLRAPALEFHCHRARIERVEGLCAALPCLLRLDDVCAEPDVLRVWRAVLWSELCACAWCGAGARRRPLSGAHIIPQARAPMPRTHARQVGMFPSLLHTTPVPSTLHADHIQYHPKVGHVGAWIAPPDGLLAFAWSHAQHRARRRALPRGAQRRQLAASGSERSRERGPAVERTSHHATARGTTEGARHGQVEHHEDQQHRALCRRGGGAVSGRQVRTGRGGRADDEGAGAGGGWSGFAEARGREMRGSGVPTVSGCSSMVAADMPRPPLEAQGRRELER